MFKLYSESSFFFPSHASYTIGKKQLFLDLLACFSIGTSLMKTYYILCSTESRTVSLLLLKGKLQHTWIDSIGHCYSVILK